eukprot:CAMPEP_0171918064 /NCGR_PEP_ID=MMETSP0993-20121228/16709_1 /TAXON_ID=483369 /ORGANISM="non described non described, Strain CCMP2098" /LENGTH=143 /DNA_ID=CAMNT_0012554209 /DNA_START=44 /DNA_END=476 /DNA_ORIENTATION=+
MLLASASLSLKKEQWSVARKLEPQRPQCSLEVVVPARVAICAVTPAEVQTVAREVAIPLVMTEVQKSCDLHLLSMQQPPPNGRGRPLAATRRQRSTSAALCTAKASLLCRARSWHSAAAAIAASFLCAAAAWTRTSKPAARRV